MIDFSYTPRVLDILKKAGWASEVAFIPWENKPRAKSKICVTPTEVGAKEKFRPLLDLLKELDVAEETINPNKATWYHPENFRGKINPSEIACVCSLARSYAGDYDRPEMPRALNILNEAGWITNGNGTKLVKSPFVAQVSAIPTVIGRDRFQTLLALLKELDAIAGELNPDEAAFVCGLARTYAAGQGPSDLPSGSRC